MGKLEKREKEIVRKTRLQKAILTSVAAAGLLGVGLLAPNVISALDKLGVLPSREDEVVRSAASRLRKKGLLRVEDGHYALTELGEKILNRWQMSDYILPKPPKWDKKWRIIIFDVPEKKRKARVEVRTILIEAGFRRLQDSVWVYPYDCEDMVGLLKTNLGIGKDVLYIIADQIEDDRRLRQDFGLL